MIATATGWRVSLTATMTPVVSGFQLAPTLRVAAITMRTGIGSRLPPMVTMKRMARPHRLKLVATMTRMGTGSLVQSSGIMTLVAGGCRAPRLGIRTVVDDMSPSRNRAITMHRAGGTQEAPGVITTHRAAGSLAHRRMVAHPSGPSRLTQQLPRRRRVL